MTNSTPEGLLDLAALTQTANEFFRASPGASPPSLPSGLSGLTSGLFGSPALLSAPVGSLPSIPGSQSVPSPLAHAPVHGATEIIPATAAPASPSSSPYYFLGESSAYHRPVTPQLPAVDDRVTANAFGLPGEAAIQEIMGESIRPPSSLASRAPAEPTRIAPEYYFLNTQKTPLEKPPVLPSQAPARLPFDVNAVRRDFPILSERVKGKPLIWFDNAATTQKPQAVIDRLAYFYQHENSNIHRAAHELAARSTDAYEGARNKVARFLGAGSASEIVFVRGATEAINLVAATFGRQHIGKDDEIVVSLLEHHANIVPWQLLAQEKSAKLRVIPVDAAGQIRLDEYQKLLNDRTKLVAITQVSNALGTITPVKQIVDMAHQVGARVLVDGAQAVSHMRVNVQALDADFYVFSGHKLFAPTGIGVVYGKADLLESLPPYQGGGNMIADVTFEKTVYQKAPARFEAGTGNIADAVGLGAAIDYLERLGMENIGRYEHDLLVYATRGLQGIPGLKLIGTAAEKASVVSFVLDGYKTEEVGSALNEEGIAVRSGHHCAQPILRNFGLEATVRPSLAFYNTCEEVDVLVATVKRLSARNRKGL